MIREHLVKKTKNKKRTKKNQKRTKKNQKRTKKEPFFRKKKLKKYFHILIMKKYNCERCGFHTNHKPNFERHLKTNKHNESPQSHHLVTTKSPFLTKKNQHHFSVIIVLSNLNLNRVCTDTLNTIVKKTRMRI